MGKSLIRKNQLSTDIADLVGQYGSGFFISTSQTGSFTASLTGANVVYTTGNQTISGLKNFITRPTVNGSGVLLIGEAAGGGTVLATGKNIVYTTGDQIISGTKTFEKIDIKASDGNIVGYISGESLYSSYQKLVINGVGGPDEQNVVITSAGNTIQLGEDYFNVTNNNGYLTFDGYDDIYINAPGGWSRTFNLQPNVIANFNGDVSFNKRPLVNGTGVLLSGESIQGKQGLSDDPYIGGNFGTIQLNGGNASVDNGPANGGNAGSINLNGGSAYDGLPGNAGSIDLHGGTDRGHAGSITLYGYQASRGGSISSKGGNIGCHGGNINLDGGVAGGSINRNISGGDINLSANSGASFSIQYANLPTQSDGSIYNKINDNLYIRKSGSWDKVITNKDNLVYATGNQTISGAKTFVTRPTVNGTGVLLSGDKNIVYTTGDQTISGIKTFDKVLKIQNFDSPEGINRDVLSITGNISDAVTHTTISLPYVSNDDSDLTFDVGGNYLKIGGNNYVLYNNGPGGIQINGNNRLDLNSIYGDVSFNKRPLVNGTGVLLIGEATAGGSVSGVVYTTGNQTISGTKTFVSNTVLYSGVNVNFNSDTNVKFSGNTDFTKLPTVNNTGILLAGQNSVIFNCSTSFITYSANTTGYFSNFNAGSTNGVSALERQMPILDNFIAKKYVYSIQPESVGTPWSDIKCTGYFINTTQQKTGVILTGIPALGTVTANKVYNYTGTLNIPINAGDNVVCALNSVDAIQSIRSIVQIYLYN